MTEPRPYRGIDANGSWVRGSLLTFGKRRFIIPPAVDDDGGRLSVALGRWIEVDSETVGQFTGLKDKNGTEIFEGDIVKWMDSDGAVRIDFVQFAFAKFFLCNSQYSVYKYVERDLIVIGNIHQNPDLLKGAE